MVKILSQAGISLADIYDVKGSIAGIEQLETRELPIVHEVGATVFSERFSTTVRRRASGNLNQSTTFDLILTDLPDVPSRLLGVAILCDVPSRISFAAVLVRDPIGGREMPVWVYDAPNASTVRIVDNGAAVANTEMLHGNSNLDYVPNFVGGSGQPQIVDDIALRGQTTAFGAGTVFITGLYYIAFGQVGGISSRGLPIPSW